ncbi:MAG: hypothetical protein HRT66_09925 [Flavobacteriaceae bacterium]|nr:hypothetical protein [Flavobacteriaceae bacterium]
MSLSKSTEYNYLESTRIMFENTLNHQGILEALANVGYTEEVITEGKNIYLSTKEVFDLNKKEDDETREGRIAYEKAYTLLEKHFKNNRKKAKIIFREDSAIQQKLMISGSSPKSYPTLVEACEKFYGVLSIDTELQAMVTRLAITTNNIEEGKTLLTDLQKRREYYKKEIGESQNATKQKDKSLKELEYWVRDFKQVNEIALEDQPQLLEVLGYYVPS